MDPRNPGRGAWLREGGLALLAVVVGCSAVAAWGFRAGVSNNEFHFPILLLGRHEAVFRGDALVATLGGFASPLWRLLASLPADLPIDGILLAALVASRALLAWGFGLLAAAFAPPEHRGTVRVLATVSTMASAWILPLPLGADPVIGTYFSQTFLSVGLLVAALGLGFSGRPLASAAFLGAAYDVNLMQANFAAGILVLHWSLSDGVSLRSAGRLIRNLAVVGLVAVPGLLAMAATLGAHGGPAMDGRELSGFAAFHIPGHFFVSLKPPLLRIQGLSLLLLLPVAGLLAGVRRSLLPVLAVPLAYVVAHIALLQAAPCRFLFQLHLFRSDVLAFAIAAGLCLAAAAREMSARRSRPAAIWVAASCLVLTGNFLFALALLGATLATDRLSGVRGWIAAAASVLLAVAAHRLAGGPATGLALFALASPSLLPASTLVPGRWLHPAVAAGILLASGAAMVRTLVVDVRRPAADPVQEAYRSALGRARAESPPDAVFTVPPSMNSRPELRRGVYWTIWDGAGFLWSRGHELEVLRRMRLSGVTYTPGRQYVDTAIDRQWARSLCSSAPRLAAEGVTHAVVPVEGGKLAPGGGRFSAMPLAKLRDDGFCPDLPAGDPHGR